MTFKSILKPIVLIMYFSLATGLVAASQEVSSSWGGAMRGLRLKPSDVVLPEGVPIGEYRRIIQPFENWILICDENLKLKQKICNISQTVIDGGNEMVFSWSLAATKKGDPLMILRVPAKVGKDKDISVKFAGRGALLVKLMNCNTAVCIGMLPVGPVMRGEIKKESMTEISYRIETLETQFSVPLKGLSTALAAIK